MRYLLPVQASTAVTHISIIGHGLVAHGKARVKFGHRVVWKLEPVLVPQTLLFQALPGSFTLLQRDPVIHQKEQF